MSGKNRTTSIPKAKTENVEVNKLQLDVTKLKEVVRTLGHTLDEMEAKALVSSQVTSLPEKELDRLNQYGRRTSLIIKGIPVQERETN